MTEPIHIGFPVYPNYTHLDFAGPWEVLTRVPGTRCHLVADSLMPARGSGLQVLPTTTFGLCPPLDVLCVPGGPTATAAMADAALLDFLRAQAPGCRYVTSVCSGSLILGAAGLLDGYKATSHWLARPHLARFGATPVAERVVIDRNRITGGGVTAGIDFGLTLAALLAGETVAREIALQMEYAPAPPFPGDPETALPETVAALRTRAEAARQR